MKFSIGTNIKEGPWGGGNLFAINLKNHLESNGHTIINHLLDDDIDIILITEPRRTSESSAFTHIEVKRYLTYVNSKTIVFHRINECDERKGTNFVNKYLIQANKIADYTIFVSTWLKNLYEDQEITKNNNKVILAGADSQIFNRDELIQWNPKNKLKIVTHHWGANWKKGFDIYSKLDNLLDSEEWSNKFEFTYIGNLPKNFAFRNVKVVAPLSGNELASEIKKNNVYITGSLNEPSGNHHIEGAQCGLPLMYVDSGGVTEYCKDFGLSITVDNLEVKILEIINEYDEYFNKMVDYPHSSFQMCCEYEALFLEAIQDKEIYINRYLHNESSILFKFIFKIYRGIAKKLKNNIK